MVSLCPVQYSSRLKSPTVIAGMVVLWQELGDLVTVQTADTLMCLGRREVAELSGLYFEIDVGVAKFVIFPSTSGQEWKFSLGWFNFLSFSADLEAREREAQSRESEEEDIRITRSLEQEVMTNS